MANGWLARLATVPAIGIPANSAGTIAYWQLPMLGEQPEFLAMLWSLNVVLFYSVFILWGIGIAGFSLAGRATTQMPAWLWILGLIVGVFGIGMGGCISLVLKNEWISGLASVGFILTPIWIVSVSVILLRTHRT